jgi:hypothetical protein
VIRVSDEAGNVIGAHKHIGDFKEPGSFYSLASPSRIFDRLQVVTELLEHPIDFIHSRSALAPLKLANKPQAHRALCGQLKLRPPFFLAQLLYSRR